MFLFLIFTMIIRGYARIIAILYLLSGNI